MKLHPRVRSVEDLKKSVLAFHKGTDDDRRRAINSKPIYFVHMRGPNGHRFALSKFAAFARLSVADYHGKKVKQHYNGNQNKAWIAKVTGRPWTPLTAAPAATQRAFRQWFTALMGREPPTTYAVQLMELGVGHQSSKNVPSSKGNKATLPKKNSPRRARNMTPEQLARRLLAQAATGAAGELIAVRDEIQRLRRLGAKNPKALVHHVAATTVNKGYDIESRWPRSPRTIEVKSSTDGFSDGFFLSRKELKVLADLGDTAYLYLVRVTNVARAAGKVVQRIRNPIPHLKAHANLEPVLLQVRLPATT